jgi:hypothetical protein
MPVKTPLRRAATIERKQPRFGITLVFVEWEAQASLGDAGTTTRVHRGLKPTAKFTPALRDEENAPFARRSGQ